MGRSASVFNKKSRERVARSKKTLGTAVKRITPSVPQAHAIVQANPNAPQNRPPMDRGSAESPIDRVGRFVTNIGRGSLDVGKSYTTDIVDTVGSAVTGSDSEVATRSIKDRTLLDAYVTSAFEGNLNPAFQETGRRVLEQPGRVVGEVAAEVGFMVGTMGFGALTKGAKAASLASTAAAQAGKTSSKQTVTSSKSIMGAIRGRGSNVFEQRTYMPEDMVRIQKGTKEVTKKMGPLDKAEYMGYRAAQPLIKYTKSKNLRIPGASRMTRFYGFGNVVDSGIGKTSQVREEVWGTTARGKNMGKAPIDTSPQIDIGRGAVSATEFDTPGYLITKPGQYPIKDLASFQQYIARGGKDLPTAEVFETVADTSTPYIREGASMDEFGDVSIKSSNVYDDAGDLVEDSATQYARKNTGISRTPGADLTKEQAEAIAMVYARRAEDQATIPLKNIKEIKAPSTNPNGTKKPGRYEVRYSAGNSIRKKTVEASSPEKAGRMVGESVSTSPGIMGKGTKEQEGIAIRKWVESGEGRTAVADIISIADFPSTIRRASAAGITPEEWAAASYSAGFRSEGRKLGGTITDSEAQDILMMHAQLEGRKGKNVRSMVNELTDYGVQISPGGSQSFRYKDNLNSMFGSAVRAVKARTKQILNSRGVKFGSGEVGVGHSPSNIITTDGIKASRAYDGMKSTGEKAVGEVSNWKRIKDDVLPVTVNPETGKLFTKKELRVMTANPNKKSNKMPATDFSSFMFENKIDGPKYINPTKAEKERAIKLYNKLRLKEDPYIKPLQNYWLAVNPNPTKRITTNILNAGRTPTYSGQFGIGSRARKVITSEAKIKARKEKVIRMEASRKAYNKIQRRLKTEKPDLKGDTLKKSIKAEMKSEGIPYVETTQTKLGKDKFAENSLDDLIKARQVTKGTTSNQYTTAYTGSSRAEKMKDPDSIYSWYDPTPSASTLVKEQTRATLKQRFTKGFNEKTPSSMVTPPTRGNKRIFGDSMEDFGKMLGLQSGVRSSKAVTNTRGKKTDKSIDKSRNWYGDYFSKGSGTVSTKITYGKGSQNLSGFQPELTPAFMKGIMSEIGLGLGSSRRALNYADNVLKKSGRR